MHSLRDQLRTAADGPLRSPTHRVRWHRTRGSRKDEASGLHYGRGKFIEPKEEMPSENVSRSLLDNLD